mmetsp:Transcript_23448/g.23646  ORF Transcript_23448/g.23646 Transcript_23448/m.23646 type:complete len:217 (-) Transcript_23448:97-747(-)
MEIIRQIAALIFAITFAWEIFRDQQNLESFTLWAVALHFVYFQLPLKSRALAFFHPISFVGALCKPIKLIFLLYHKQDLFQTQMELWEITWTSVILRCMLIYGFPLLSHSLDLSVNQSYLIQSYQTKPKKFQIIWSFSSFFLFGLVFDFFVPSNYEDQDLEGITPLSFSRQKKILILAVSSIAFGILYSVVLRKAYSTSNALPSRRGSGASRHKSR